MYEIDLSKSIFKFIEKQTNKQSIYAKLTELKDFNTSTLDIKMLHGKFKGKYRLRLGKIRFIFFIEDDVIKIYEAGFRGNIYK